jgi:hypothetical protein
VSPLAVMSRARAAGLTLVAGPGGLSVRGPKGARDAFRSELAAAAREIIALLDRLCADCGRDAPVAVLLDDGRRLCRLCLFPRPAGRCQNRPREVMPRAAERRFPGTTHD